MNNAENARQMGVFCIKRQLRDGAFSRARDNSENFIMQEWRKRLVLSHFRHP